MLQFGHECQAGNDVEACRAGDRVYNGSMLGILGTTAYFGGNKVPGRQSTSTRRHKRYLELPTSESRVDP